MLLFSCRPPAHRLRTVMERGRTRLTLAIRRLAVREEQQLFTSARTVRRRPRIFVPVPETGMGAWSTSGAREMPTVIGYSGNHRAQRPAERGFSLIEVMISMVVLTVGLISLLGVFGLAMASTQ